MSKPTDVPESTKLLPCPFCGSKGVVHKGDEVFWTECHTCNVDLEYQTTREQAIAAWNQRTPAASPVAPPESAGHEPEKRCCTVCDAKKLCHVCGQPTLYACSDCRIDFGVSIYVCPTKECRMAHEAKCSAVLIARANPSAEGDGR